MLTSDAFDWRLFVNCNEALVKVLHKQTPIPIEIVIQLSPTVGLYWLWGWFDVDLRTDRKSVVSLRVMT